MRKLYPLLFIALLFSCKATVESETNRWESNKSKLNEYANKYDKASDFLEKELAEASKVYEAALNETDTEKQIKSIKQANKKLNQGLFGEFKDLETTISSSQSDVDKLERLYNDNDNNFDYGFMISQVNKSIQQAKYLEFQNKAYTKSEIIAVIGNAKSNLKSINTDVNRAISKIERYNRKQEDQKRAEEKEKVKDDEPQKEIVSTVNCDYCGTKNSSKNSNCTSCKAGLK